MEDVFNLSLWNKKIIICLADLMMTILAWLSAVWISNQTLSLNLMLVSLSLLASIQCLIYFFCGLYRGVWRFASIPDLMRILRAVILGMGISALLFVGLNLSIKTFIAYALFLICFLTTPRLLYRLLCEQVHLFPKGKRVLIVGAGSAGDGIIRTLTRFPLNRQYRPIAIVDDNFTQLGREVHGVRIMGKCEDIPKIVKQKNIELILIAIPSATSTRMRELISYCEKTKVPFRTLPNIKDIAAGIVTFQSVREVLLEDLLGRDQVSLDWQNIKGAIFEKIILVTGGGGSIGSELCRQIGLLQPKKLIIVDNNEFNLYSIDLELKTKFPNLDVYSHLCSVTDKIELEKIFSIYHPHHVFHVAAYKHVPLLESHIRVAMYNNIIGARYVAELASAWHVHTFVLISTDKAVNPTNVMGATKRASEIICQNFNFMSQTKFITVRFGNVLNSAGSVIPLFRKQLAEGGPLTVTHPEISRYFMTITEASQLILQAAAMNESCGIFVLDMGQPIKIRYLAEQMIKLSGKSIGKDVDIQYVGLRPGEKLHEELFHACEDICDTIHPKIKRAKVRTFDGATLLHILNAVEVACEKNQEETLKTLLGQLVPEWANHEVAHKIKPTQNPIPFLDLAF